jgi:hypothetical protein
VSNVPAYTEKFESPQGQRTRVRAGPFPSQEAAEKARSQDQDHRRRWAGSAESRPMTAFDYAVLALVFECRRCSGLWRGVVSEILALVAWVVAFLVARAQAPEVSDWLAGQVVEPGMRLAAAYVLVLVSACCWPSPLRAW